MRDLRARRRRRAATRTTTPRSRRSARAFRRAQDATQAAARSDASEPARTRRAAAKPKPAAPAHAGDPEDAADAEGPGDPAARPAEDLGDVLDGLGDTLKGKGQPRRTAASSPRTPSKTSWTSSCDETAPGNIDRCQPGPDRGGHHARRSRSRCSWPTTPTAACRSCRPTRSSAVVPDAAELVPGNDVNVGGARVGQVTEVRRRCSATSAGGDLTMKLEKPLDPLPDRHEAADPPALERRPEVRRAAPGRDRTPGIPPGGTLPLRNADAAGRPRRRRLDLRRADAARPVEDDLRARRRRRRARRGPQPLDREPARASSATSTVVARTLASARHRPARLHQRHRLRRQRARPGRRAAARAVRPRRDDVRRAGRRARRRSAATIDKVGADRARRGRRLRRAAPAAARGDRASPATPGRRCGCCPSASRRFAGALRATGPALGRAQRDLAAAGRARGPDAAPGATAGARRARCGG